MHIVERFTFDPQKFSPRRDYSVTDPVCLAAPYESYDVMYPSEVPFQKQPCKDMTPEFQKKQSCRSPGGMTIFEFRPAVSTRRRRSPGSTGGFRVRSNTRR